jgi:hypothetical protein
LFFLGYFDFYVESKSHRTHGGKIVAGHETPTSQ